ncbi:MAG: hypothetical protein QF819_01825 [Gemmatimonadota bacterium]|jgi:hypothetical protein|nr:hypothetical protein [Gemmatimonadota bacterium]MDP6801903.1 hypothetical protein [Gemmatimonadota bacterium]MDP7031629.1 hypothetical protein [Gemmatimonadota bacterium]
MTEDEETMKIPTLISLTLSCLLCFALIGCGGDDNTVSTLPPGDDDPPVDLTPPAVPSNLAVSEIDDTLWVNWAPNSEADLAGYELQRSLDHGTTWEAVSSSLLQDASYFDQVHSRVDYRAASEDASGNRSSYSNKAIYFTPSEGGGKIPTNPTG